MTTGHRRTRTIATALALLACVGMPVRAGATRTLGRGVTRRPRAAHTAVRMRPRADVADAPSGPAGGRVGAPDFPDDQPLPLLAADMGPRFDAATKALSVSIVLGLAAYRFFSVDADLSRGWTALEIGQRLLPDNWNEYESALQEDPVVTKTMINTVIYALADWLAQVLEGRQPLDFDPRRLLRSASTGLIFGPITCAYYEFSDSILDPFILTNRPLKILMDQSVYAAAKYTAFVCLRETLSGTPPDKAFATARKSTWPLLKRGWRFWPAVHMITYSVIPPRHRVLWVNCADLVWVTILSLFKAQEDAKAAAAAVAEAAVLAEGGADSSEAYDGDSGETYDGSL